MSSTANMQGELSLVPLGAGDLIDRAVRFYRKNFLTLLLIATPPVAVGSILSLAWILTARWVFGFDPTAAPESSLTYYILTTLVGFLVWGLVFVALMSVMGGASRNFVRHLMFAEPISFKDSYKNTFERLIPLLVSSSLIVLSVAFVVVPLVYFGLIVAVLLISLAVLVLGFFPPLAFIFGTVLGSAAILGSYFLFCLIASRFAYVPQAILVEGLGAIAAIGRSFSLASGNVKRFAALLAFTILAIYSALAILYVPLFLYAWIEGEASVFMGGPGSAIYEIASGLIVQAGIILLAPVWMIGMCLLYVDERVRHEGYDIELLAAKRLGDIPDVPETYYNPLQPALGHRPEPSIQPRVEPRSTHSTLGLD
jgi:hypothetical protein